MLAIEHIDKSYGDVEALKDVSFHIDDGEIVGLLGPNGAGKTTLIKILTGYLQPDAGSATINGLDVLTNTREVQAQIGYLPENAPLYPELSVQQYLKMVADMREMPASEQRAHISEAVYAAGLQEHLTFRISELSKGFRQRVCLAQAILHKPKLLILDEPTVGLDPTQIIEIRTLIRRLSENSTILFSTHILPEVEALCNRAIILMRGEIKADARLSELAGTADAIVVLQEDVAGVEEALSQVAGVRGVEAMDFQNGAAGYRVKGSDDADLCPHIYDIAREHDWPLRELRRDVRTLETVFNELAISA